jgi:hypothetical protein
VLGGDCFPSATVIKQVARWPAAKLRMAESIQIKLQGALSGEVDDQPDHDPAAAPGDGE